MDDNSSQSRIKWGNRSIKNLSETMFEDIHLIKSLICMNNEIRTSIIQTIILPPLDFVNLFEERNVYSFKIN